VKKISENQMIELCEASQIEIDCAAQLLGKTFSTDAAWVSDGIKLGHYKAETVTVGGTARFLLIFHVNQQRVLFINAAAQLTRDFSDFGALSDGMIALAKKYACRAVEGMTLRAGVLKKLLENGFTPIGVTVQCPV